MLNITQLIKYWGLTLGLALVQYSSLTLNQPTCTVLGLTMHWLFAFQLYELSHDPKRKEFLDDLFNFMQKRGMHCRVIISRHFESCDRE